MKNQRLKITLAITLVLAMAFALSCSSEDGEDGATTNNTIRSSSSTAVNLTTYYDVVIGNLSTNCPNISTFSGLLNSVMPVNDFLIEMTSSCLINREDYSYQTPAQVTSFLNANNLGGYVNDFNQKIIMSPYYGGILIYTNASGYYRVLVIGYSGYNRIPPASSSSAGATSSSSETLVSSSSETCDIACANQVQSEAAASGSLYSGAFCNKVASCGISCKERHSQCGSSSQSNMVECGTNSYDANNTNLRCQNGVVETKCGTSWYDAKNTSLRCQNSIVETKCGTYGWYDATNANLRCQNSVVETKCGTSWYNATNTNLRCQNSVVETKCGTNGWYDATNANFRCQNSVVEEKCGAIWYTTNANLRCQNNVIETWCYPNIWYDATNTNLRCVGALFETKCGTNGWYDATNTNLRCQNSIVEAKCGTNSWYDISTKYCANGTTVEDYSFVDYGGKSYKTVTIGTQIWMAENLNYNVTGSKCNTDKDNQSMCDTYGRLYDWATAMGISSSYNSNYYNPSESTKYRGVCPQGWHIPSIGEWNELTTYIERDKNCSDCAYKHLKSRSGWAIDYNDGLDSYGFSALPGGYKTSAGFFLGGSTASWWSASESYNSFAKNWQSDDRGYASKSDLLSVRCLKDD